MVLTAETSDADVPVPVKSRMGGVEPRFNATGVLAGAPSVEPEVPQPLKPIKIRAVDARTNMWPVLVTAGRRYEFITRLPLERMTARRFFISGGPNSLLGFIGLELDRLLLSRDFPPDMPKVEVTLVHGTRRGST